MRVGAGLDLPDCDSRAGAFETSLACYLGVIPREGREDVRAYTGRRGSWLETMSRPGLRESSPEAVPGRPDRAPPSAGERIPTALANNLVARSRGHVAVSQRRTTAEAA